MLNQEIENAKALQDLCEFGSRCYKSGYRRAGIDILVGFGLITLSMISMGLIDRIATRRD